MKICFLPVALLFLNVANAAEEQKITDDTIKLNVGGKFFTTSRNTLCSRGGPLEMMFRNNSSMAPSKLVDGCWFLDDDPELFKMLLFFLRYNKLSFATKADAKNARIIADKFCPAMSNAIDAWLTLQSALKVKIEVCKLPNKDRKDNWFVRKVHNGQVIGCTEWGCVVEHQTVQLVSEFENRKKFKTLCYSWSGAGFSIYNCNNSKLIGEISPTWNTNNTIKDTDAFLQLKLIEKAKKVSSSRIYVCTFDKNNNFSIFNAVTSEKMLPHLSFPVLTDCVKVLEEALANHTL